MAIRVPRVKLGSQGLEVSAQGLGCMSMSAFYGPPKPEPDMINLIHDAINAGVTFLDTSDMYGPKSNEILLGKALKGEMRAKSELATKFGFKHDGSWEVCGDPAFVRAACEASLKRLDVDCIDLYYQHRIDTRVPIEITLLDPKHWLDLLILLIDGRTKEAGGRRKNKICWIIRGIGINHQKGARCASNNRHTTRMVLVRDVEEDIIPTCRELGIGIVAYSPLGRGFFSSGLEMMEKLDESDARRKSFPRFQPEHLEHNKILYERLNNLAKKKGCTTSQLALAWVHHQGNDVVPIPGTTKIKNLEQNIGALSVELTPEEMAELESFASADSVKGGRYADGFPTYLDSETPPLSSWKA